MADQHVTFNAMRRAKLLRSQGYTWREVAAELGFKHHTTIRTACMRGNKSKDDTFSRGAAGHSETRRKARELMQQIPADTRDLTATLMGDPLVGRRALDKLNRG